MGNSTVFSDKIMKSPNNNVDVEDALQVDFEYHFICLDCYKRGTCEEIATHAALEHGNQNWDIALDDYENRLVIEPVSDCEEEKFELLSEDEFMSLDTTTSHTVHHINNDSHTVQHYPSEEDLLNAYMSNYEEHFSSKNILDEYLEDCNFAMAS